MKRPDTDTELRSPGNPFPSRPNPATPELEAGLSSINQSFVWTARESAGKEGTASFPFGFMKCSHPVEMTRVLVSCRQLFWLSE